MKKRKYYPADLTNNTTVEQHATMLQKLLGEDKVCRLASSIENMPYELYSWLSRHGKLTIRLALAENKTCPRTVLLRLLSDASYLVRAAVIENPSLWVDDLVDFANGLPEKSEHIDSVVEAIMKHPHANADHIVRSLSLGGELQLESHFYAAAARTILAVKRADLWCEEIAEAVSNRLIAMYKELCILKESSGCFKKREEEILSSARAKVMLEWPSRKDRPVAIPQDFLDYFMPRFDRLSLTYLKSTILRDKELYSEKLMAELILRLT